MQELKERIVKEGKVLPGNIIKVDGFLNHRIDTGLLTRIAEEFGKYFNMDEVTMVLTAEASGIALATAVATYFHKPMIFAKKAKSDNIEGGLYQSDIYSYTYKKKVTLLVSKEWLSSDDKVLIIDDFMANGEAMRGLCDIVTAAGATLLGIGCAVEKGFQGGGDRLRGVDSSVVAALLIKAIGKQLICVHVNHGLLRKGEPEQVIEVFQNQMDANLIYVDAVDRFLDKLAGISDPEQKRKIIGKEFIDVFAEEAQKLEGISFLAQGTIYPDILESDGIKSHHNVGGLPEDLQFELVEPVKLLYKDEVRVVGKALGLPDNMVYRQPFPGPGLGVRCIGAITRDRLEAVRESDAILREEFAKNGLEGKVWQYFTVVPDIKSTGIIDGKRSFDWPVIIRAVNTVDAVTAEVAQLDFGMMQHIVDRITHEVSGVNRVLWDLTPKPTGTIEWE